MNFYNCPGQIEAIEADRKLFLASIGVRVPEVADQPPTYDQRIDSLNDIINAADSYLRYRARDSVCGCEGDGANNGYKCAIESHRRWFEKVHHAKLEASRLEHHREKFAETLDAIRGLRRESEKIPAEAPEQTPSARVMPTQFCDLNLKTVHDIKEVTSAIVKEIENNAEIISALNELKTTVLILKGQKRVITKLDEEITELFTE